MKLTLKQGKYYLFRGEFETFTEVKDKIKEISDKNFTRWHEAKYGLKYPFFEGMGYYSEMVKENYINGLALIHVLLDDVFSDLDKQLVKGDAEVEIDNIIAQGKVKVKITKD